MRLRLERFALVTTAHKQLPRPGAAFAPEALATAGQAVTGTGSHTRWRSTPAPRRRSSRRWTAIRLRPARGGQDYAATSIDGGVFAENALMSCLSGVGQGSIRFVLNVFRGSMNCIEGEKMSAVTIKVPSKKSRLIAMRPDTSYTVVAHGNRWNKVVAAAKKAGVANPAIMWVPDPRKRYVF